MSKLENNDQTLVADRGQNLSKGQQARINLARAIYRESDFYILDDTLTCLDENIQDYVFHNAICKLKAFKIILMVTQNPKHLERADFVISMEKGSSINNKCQIACHETDLVQQMETTNAAVDSKDNGSQNLYDEYRKSGKVDFEIYKQYINFGGGYVLLFVIISLYIIAQYVISYSDKQLTTW